MSELYKQGLNRSQQLLFPPSIDDYLEEENSARADGQKAYSPKLLLSQFL